MSGLVSLSGPSASGVGLSPSLYGAHKAVIVAVKEHGCMLSSELVGGGQGEHLRTRRGAVKPFGWEREFGITPLQSLG